MGRFSSELVRKLAAAMRDRDPAQEFTAEKQNALIERFVEQYSGKARQREAGWYQAMGATIGGSELAAIMGVNPYTRFDEVVMSKLASLKGIDTFNGGEACWWGVLFEDVIAAAVEIDLGGKIRGDEICIQVYPGHRNSPDGYIVARFSRHEVFDADGARSFTPWELVTTDAPPGADAIVRSEIVLLEFKCPVSRKPTMAIPKQYAPQLWSGLMVSPIAQRGLFIDAVFRKCEISALGDSPDYDQRYHTKDERKAKTGKRGTVCTSPEEEADMLGSRAPFAWGLIAFYAPLASAPAHVRYGWRGETRTASDPDPELYDADGAEAGVAIHRAYFGEPCVPATAEPADLGDMEPRLFGRTLGLFDRGLFKVNRATPCFADSRGLDLRTDRGVRATMRQFRRDTPPNYWFLGVLPWKLFEITYIPIERRAGFDREAMPLIEEVHQCVREALEAVSASEVSVSAASLPPRRSDTALAPGATDTAIAVAAMNYVIKKLRPEKEGHSSVINGDETQDLFDYVS